MTKNKIYDSIIVAFTLIFILLYWMNSTADFYGGILGKIILTALLLTNLLFVRKFLHHPNGQLRIFGFICMAAIVSMFGIIIIGIVLGEWGSVFLNILIFLVVTTLLYFTILRKITKSRNQKTI